MTDSGELSYLADALVTVDINYNFGYHSWVSRRHRYVCITVPKMEQPLINVANRERDFGGKLELNFKGVWRCFKP